MARRPKRLEPIHPGEILREEYLGPLGLSAHRLAVELHVPATRIAEIVNGQRSITADTALRLARYFDTSPHLWINLQAAYDLQVAEDAGIARIRREVRPRKELTTA